MQHHDPPPAHRCYDEYIYRDFFEGVTLIIQDLTETVGHSKTEKRFFHIMMEGTNAMILMKALADDYLRYFYYPLQRLRDVNERDLELPEIDPEEIGWLPLMQGSLQASLTHFALAEERSTEPLGSPTCTPHIIVIHPHKRNKVVYAGIVPALHAPHEHEPEEDEEEEEEKEDDHSGHDHGHLHNIDHRHVAPSDNGL